MAGGLTDPDIHGIALSGGQPKWVLATTPREVFASTNAGESWQRLEVMKQFPHAYTRAIAVKEDDPHVIFVGHGKTASPTIGSVQRSQDGGKTWETLPLPGEPNSYISRLATHPAIPDLMLASSLYGQLFWSRDGGTHGRRFGKSSARCRRWRGCHPKRTRGRECDIGQAMAGGVPKVEIWGIVSGPNLLS